MPVTGATTRNDYVATSGQTVFVYTFQILVGSDIKVIKNGTLLTLSNDYTVSSAGVAGGGNVTLLSSASAGDNISLFLAMPIDRTTEYQNAGDFLASDVNGDFDKGYIAMNQLQTDIARSIGLKDYDPSVDMTLPVAGSRANKFLKFNAQGLPVADTGIPVGDAFITPAQFGALGDGSDDTAAIMALVDYVKANGGGTIDLEDKTYSVGATIAFGVPITLLCGSGAGFRALTSGSFTSITGRSGAVNINPDNGNPYTVLFDIDGMGYSSFQGRFILTSNGQEKLMGGEVKYIPNLVAIAQQDGTGPVQALNGYFESLYVTRLHCAFFQPEKVVGFGPVLPYTRTFFARLEIIKCYQAWNFLHVNGFDDCAVGVLRVNKCAADAFAKAFDLDCLEAFFAGGKATATGTFSTTATSTAFTVSADADVAVGDAIMIKGAETYGQGFVTKIATLSGTSGTFEDACPVAVTNAEFIFAAGGFDMDRATFVCAKLYLEGVHHKLLYFTRQATLDCQTLKFSTGEFACYQGRPIVFEHINSLCNIGSIPQSEHGVNGNPLVDVGLGKLIQSYVYYGLRSFIDLEIPPDSGNTFDFFPDHNCTIKMMMTRKNFIDFGIEPVVVGHTIYDPAGFPGGSREYSTSNSQLFVEYSDQTIKVSGDIGGQDIIVSNGVGQGLTFKDFGAEGNGIADDTAAVQAAFDYAAANKIVLDEAAGVFLVNAPIVVGDFSGIKGNAANNQDAICTIKAGANFTSSYTMTYYGTDTGATPQTYNVASILISKAWVDGEQIGNPIHIGKILLDADSRKDNRGAPIHGIMIQAWASLLECNTANTTGFGIFFNLQKSNGDFAGNHVGNHFSKNRVYKSGVVPTGDSAPLSYVTNGNTHYYGAFQAGSLEFTQDSAGNQVQGKATDAWITDFVQANTCTGTAVRVINGGGWSGTGIHLNGAGRHGIYVDGCLSSGWTDNYVDGWGVSIGENEGNYYAFWFADIFGFEDNEANASVTGSNNRVRLREITNTTGNKLIAYGAKGTAAPTARVVMNGNSFTARADVTAATVAITYPFSFSGISTGGLSVTLNSNDVDPSAYDEDNNLYLVNFGSSIQFSSQTGNSWQTVTAKPTRRGANGEVVYNKTAGSNLPTQYVNISGANHGTSWKALGSSRSGSTANRPTLDSFDVGFTYWDTTLSKVIFWVGSSWKLADGTSA